MKVRSVFFWGALVFSLFAPDLAHAGPAAASMPVAGSSGGVCDALRNWGMLYKDPDNPWIQEFRLFGRFQYQVAYVDGTAYNTPGGTRDFSYRTDEVRRVYLGAGTKLFGVLDIDGKFNAYTDNGTKGGDEGFEFQEIWSLRARLDARKAFGWDRFDSFKIGYGRTEVPLSAEWNASSKVMKTVERSALSNKLWTHDIGFSNPTGIWVEGSMGPASWMTGAFTTSYDEWIAGWHDGELYYGKLRYDLKECTGADKSDLLWTAFYQDAPITGERLADGIEWVTCLSLTYGQGPWEVLVEGIVGDNGEQVDPDRAGGFHGLVIMPSRWLIPDRLEVAARYQLQLAEESEGIALYPRYVRRANQKEGLGLFNGGFGDEHHSFYAGMTYLLCGQNAKVMAGVQYDDISSNGQDVYEGWTFLSAFRFFW